MRALRRLFALVPLLLPVLAAPAQDSPLQVLVVTAHPDDDALFAATVWRIVREQGGAADLALMTDGAGGYRYSTLAEPLYGLNLTDPEVARSTLPAIRKKELMEGGSIVGFRNYFFFDQPDEGKILDVDSVMTHLWDLDYVAGRLQHILTSRHYDLVLTFVPLESTHAHHKAAALLAVRAVSALPADQRPVIMASFVGQDVSTLDYEGLAGYDESRIRPDGPFVLDREQPLGLNGRLNYQIVVNWLIAAHRSQGTMQLLMNGARYERFWFFKSNDDEALERGRTLFHRLGLVTP